MKVIQRENVVHLDFLNIGSSCNLNCRQCYFQEEGNLSKRTLQNDEENVQWLSREFENAGYFMYPMEITTSMNIVPIMSNVARQKVVLSNGILLNEQYIQTLIAGGVERIKITLFANYEEHNFFNRITREQYNMIMHNIKLCKRAGLTVIVNTILSKVTKNSIDALAKKCSLLEVDRLELIRLKPIGNAKSMRDIWLDLHDAKEIVKTVEQCKLIYPNLYFSYNLSFGPDFYGKTIAEAKEKMQRRAEKWNNPKYLCPAIDGQYVGVSLRSGNVYGCFFAMDEEVFRLGTVDFENKKISNLNSVLDSKELSKKLRDDCHKDNCKYHSICLGGCRSTAYILRPFTKVCLTGIINN